MIGQVRSGYGAVIQRKRLIKLIVLSAIAVLVIGISILVIRQIKSSSTGQQAVALKNWKNGDYALVFSAAEQQLLTHPLSHFWLSMQGFSAYQLASAQINAQDAGKYIDTSIASLRKALLINPSSMRGRICYVLGKDYYQKGSPYADLTVEYLEKAISYSCNSPDIYEYLGLAYASIQNYQKSVESFSKALGTNTSDLLLLSIAHSYLSLKETSTAKAYIYRCLEQSHDSAIQVQGKLMLGRILQEEGDTAAAQKEYTEILEIDDMNADAHFSIGELYASSGDLVKARAEWRRAIRIDPTHGPARSRLSS